MTLSVSLFCPQASFRATSPASLSCLQILLSPSSSPSPDPAYFLLSNLPPAACFQTALPPSHPPCLPLILPDPLTPCLPPIIPTSLQSFLPQFHQAFLPPASLPSLLLIFLPSCLPISHPPCLSLILPDPLLHYFMSSLPPFPPP